MGNTHAANVATTLAALVVAATASVHAQSHIEQSWPQWRGPLATGEAPGADPPIAWSETTNIRWKVAIPGHGHATPLVWRDRIFVATAVPVSESGVSEGLFRRLTRRVVGTEGASHTLNYVVMALDRKDGRTIWTQDALSAVPHEGRHQTGSWASPSPVTDGDVLCASFGSQGVYCYDLDGELLWDRDFGNMEIRMGFGEGTSPVLHGDAIVVNWDHQGQSFITALDKWTGHELWRVDRDEITSWATPLIVEHGGRTQVVTSATNQVRSYDFDTGELLWEGEGVTLNAIPSPVASDGLVYLTSGYRGNQLYAVDLRRAEGDITGSEAVVWALDEDTPYVPSPLLHEGILYLTKSNNGILSAFDARTGTRHYGPERLPGVRSVYASPVSAGGRIYVTSRDGTTVVLAAGPRFEVLSANMLDDEFDSSPAVVDGEIFLRGYQHLYCIAAD